MAVLEEAIEGKIAAVNASCGFKIEASLKRFDLRRSD